MNAIFAHIRNDVRHIFSTPGSVAMLLFCALISALFWPSVAPASGPTWDLGNDGDMATVTTVFVSILWIGFFPMLLALIVKPPMTGSSKSSQLAHSVLPISLRARILVDAILVLSVVLVLRVPLVLLRNQLSAGLEAYPENLAGNFLLGALLLLPAQIVLLGRSSGLEHLWLRAIMIGVLLYGAMRLGGAASPLRLTIVSLLFSAAALWIAGRGSRNLTEWTRVFSFRAHSRTAMAPDLRLRTDFVLRPILALLPFLAIVFAMMFLYARGTIGGTAFYISSTFVFSMLFGFVMLRPMGSGQAISAVFGKTGYEMGDFARSFSVLPVSRNLVLRTVYLHGLISGSILWLGVILLTAFSARLSLGETIFFTDSDGRFIAELLLPMLALIPCAAGFLVEGAVGARKPAIFSGALLVFSPQLVMILMIAGVPALVLTMTAFGIAVLGGVPSLRHLQPNAEPV